MVTPPTPTQHRHVCVLGVHVILFGVVHICVWRGRVCVCVCVCVWAVVCVFMCWATVCVLLCMCACTCVCILHVCVCAWMCACMRECMRASLHLYVCMCRCVCVCVCACVYVFWLVSAYRTVVRVDLLLGSLEWLTTIQRHNEGHGNRLSTAQQTAGPQRDHFKGSSSL